MQGIRSVAVAATLFLTLPGSFAAAQTQSPQALNWLRAGLAEKDLAKKITAYGKALEFDSLFVEAMYNLGLAYKKQQNHQLAAKWLLKASLTKPEKQSNDLKQQVLTELGKTYKKLGKLRESEQTLKNAKAIAGDAATRAAILFELGRCLYDQGLYEEALAELREGRRLSPENAENFQSFIQVVENMQETQRLHAAAEEALATGNLKQAQLLLEEIQKKSLDPKRVQVLAVKVDSAYRLEASRQALYEQAQREAAAGNPQAAVAAYEMLLQQAGVYKDAAARLESARQQAAAKQIQAQLEADYEAGMSALREKNWTAAILAFEKVLKVDEKFRDTRKKIDEAERELKDENNESVVARYYVDGVAALNRNDLASALAALERVRRLNARYRNVNALLEEIEKRLHEQAKPAVLTSEQVENLYQEALRAAEKKDWLQTVVALEKLELLQPDYRNAAALLAEARARLPRAGRDAVAEDPSSSSMLNTKMGAAGGVIVAVVLLPLIGMIAFSKSMRARLYLLRGNLAAAALLYEQILARHPERVKLYPILANLYLLIQRYDEQAMKIYKAVLNLNIATPRRDEINALVAQKYLTEGRTDSDAIEVLENALKSERLKQTHVN
ncbi:MAG: tetratricopeptide repeat protein [candidate division KSB1 bacterium]|nr:tetratricopeptide repeat protein [candidate division KSB1 bacterium]MDZ7369135.1 tetratricopeptide repeat protein [candidate division KSB1 bacterium]MDZ7407102.1 tetratricopeptide repeat protein [candidate division KSB1 bacterium]